MTDPRTVDDKALPPVGATVVDGRGKKHTAVFTKDGALFWRSPIGMWTRSDDLTLVWQLEQDRAALIEALRIAVQNHCPTDRLFCGSCTPARKLLARMEGEGGVLT